MILIMMTSIAYICQVTGIFIGKAPISLINNNHMWPVTKNQEPLQ